MSNEIEVGDKVSYISNGAPKFCIVSRIEDGTRIYGQWHFEGENPIGYETWMSSREVTLVSKKGKAMESVKPGDILVTQSDTERDYLLVLGTYKRGQVTRIAYVEIYDNSMDRGTMTVETAESNYYIKGQVPVDAGVKELTMAEVAELAGIDVDKLRIKE